MSASTTTPATTTTRAHKIITIVGATGGTGVCLVKQALEAGHIVKALVRSPEKLSDLVAANHENLTVIKGDVTDYDDVKAALKGSTDLIVCLGGHSNICSTAQPVLDRALNDTDPSIRMVVVTSMAVGDSYHDVSWGTCRVADWIHKSLIKDKNLQERSVIRDTTNWVIVRPADLRHGPLTGTEEGSPHASPASYRALSRADLAHFILTKCLSGHDEWKRYPVTVYPPQDEQLRYFRAVTVEAMPIIVQACRSVPSCICRNKMTKLSNAKRHTL